MGEFEDQVQKAALETPASGDALTPRDMVRAERVARRESQMAEADRVGGLRRITVKLRAALRESRDIGTHRFERPRPTSKIRALLQTTPRGWLLSETHAEVLLPGQFAGAKRPCRLQLVLLTDGKLYAAVDDVVWERYRYGQTEHPAIPMTFPMAVWRDVEAQVPATIGHLVGELQLNWELDA